MIVPHSVSLSDAEASKDELEALRGVMRSDAPFPDEPPSLDDLPDDFDPPPWLTPAGAWAVD